MNIKKILAVFTLATYLLGGTFTPVVIAQEAPAAPDSPSAPTAPSSPSGPSTTAPTAPPAPTGPSSSDPSPSPSATSAPTATSEPSPTPEPSTITRKPKPSPTPTPTPIQSASSPTNTSAPSTAGQQTGNQTQNGTSGGTTIETGNATNNAGVITTANDNLASLGAGAGTINSGPSAGVINSGNGTGSTNNSSATIENSNTTNQNNAAFVVNNLNQSTVTGDNSASRNTGGDNMVKTGDANTTGTMITSVNTNVDAVAVAEFNIADDHKGDIVLDFKSGCISNCGGGDTIIKNVGNGDNSTNTADVTQTNTNETFQNNDATVSNNMVLNSNSGDNKADSNTGGNSSIETGDANVVANVLTFANNNIAGNVVVTTVNIFGELVGDIIMDEKYMADAKSAASQCSTCGSGNLTASNSGNGADSNNKINVDENYKSGTFQVNDANIENNLIIDANTSGNSVSRNTDGNNSIETGNTTVDANVTNVANVNLTTEDAWMVIVHEGGKWLGYIVGSDGSAIAGSGQMEFVLDENGDVIATTSTNGDGSTNTTNYNSNTTNTTNQTNTADITNNVQLTANTGDNSANRNTGGSSNVKTGDANILANIANVVNTNIAAGRTLYITFVNILGGSWTGNFYGPGQKKDQLAQNNNNQGNPSPSVAPSSSPLVESEEVEEDQNQTTVTNTTKKKTTKKKTASPSPAVMGASTGSGGSSGGTSSILNGAAAVAGMKIGPSENDLGSNAVVGSQNVKNKIKINLAWLVIILPILGLIALSRVKMAYFTTILRKRLSSIKHPGVVLSSIMAVSLYVLDKLSQ